MAYQVLARKWRPKIFSDLVGQEHVVKALRNALKENRLHHAYLLTGTRGVGKTTIARILAKSLNCEHTQQGEPCGVCDSCTQIDAGSYVDLLEIDAASNTGIDNIREVLENTQYVPTAGKYKVYIIDEVHMLSKSAFNAMLKTLEEPPEHVKFILATTDPHKVPITVLSRCLQFVLRNMTTQQIAHHLAHVLTEENINFEASALNILSRAAHGSMRDALSLLDQAIAMGSGAIKEQDVRQMIGAVDKHYLYELLQYVVNQDGELLIQKAQEMSARAIGFEGALNELAILLQQLALLKTIPTAIDADDPEYDVLFRLAQYLSDEQIQLYYQCVIRGKEDLKLAPDEYAGFVMTLLRMLTFTPIAAKPYDLDSNIEGTELHNPEKGQQQTKKSLILPDEKVEKPIQNNINSFSKDNKVMSQSAVAEKKRMLADQEEIKKDSEHDSFDEGLIEEKNSLISEQVIESAIEEDSSSMAIDELQIPKDDMVSLSNESHLNPIDVRNYISNNTEPAITSVYQRSNVDEYKAKVDVDENVEPFSPLPKFELANWPQIVKRLAPKFGAAQMIAQHAAWVEYDKKQGIIKLALTSEAQTTTNKERLNKIQDTINECYSLELTLQTEPWKNDMGWGTPAMRRKRIQQEEKKKAQQLLEADDTAQQILTLFNAKWRPDTLALTENQD